MGGTDEGFLAPLLAMGRPSIRELDARRVASIA